MESPSTPSSQSLNPPLPTVIHVVCMPISLVVLVLFSLFCTPQGAMASLAACRGSCGPIRVKYPFGIGPGCGDPKFQNYITCHNQKQLVFKTHSGTYPVQYIDYRNHVLYINDPTMSTCSSMHSSRSFALDWAAPFRIKNDVFVLLGCSPTSLLYDPKDYLCDIASEHICSSLYTCPGLGGLDLPLYAPIGSCCVYSPINLGSALDLNLPRLQCMSYTSIQSFGIEPSSPSQWRYGLTLEYSYNIDNYVPIACRDCEESNGVCGYIAPYETFVCVCMNGINTTTNCYGQGYFWNKALIQRPMSMISIAGVIFVVSIRLLL